MNRKIPQNVESMIDMAANRTLIAAKFTNKDPLKPRIVQGQGSMEQLFQEFNPHLEIRLEDADGFSKSEQIRFRSIEDFNVDRISAQSTFLKTMLRKRDRYLMIAKQLASNAALKETLVNAPKRQQMKKILEDMIDQLTKNKD